MDEHALLSPSSAKRHLTCTPAARLEARMPNTSSTFADEGTLAHSLGELLILRLLRQIKEADFNKQFDELKKSTYYNKSMLDYMNTYAAYIIARFNAIKKKYGHAYIYLETRVYLDRWVPESFGRVDVVIIADGYTEVIDLKYGQGVSVSAVENYQQMLYALGVLDWLADQFAFNKCRLVIYQPRIDNVSVFDTDYNHLIRWAEKIKPIAEKAFAGEGEFVAGDHCQFCKVKGKCKAYGAYATGFAPSDFEDFSDPGMLSDEEVSTVLKGYKALISWAAAVEDYALQQALSGKKWPGFKLVTGRSNRVYKDEKKVEQKLLKNGYKKEDITVTSLKGIGAMEEQLGNKDFDFYLNDLIFKPIGKPSLVPEDDPRPVYSRQDDAKKVFNLH